MRAILLAAVAAWLAVPAAAEQPTVFVDRTTELGLAPANAAACWADLDNDGWVDVCTGGVVWRNRAGKGFTKVAEGLGSVVAADFDNDGFVDLFSWSRKQVYRKHLCSLPQTL